MILPVNIKRADNSFYVDPPTYSTVGSGCFDIRSAETKIIQPSSQEVFKTGWCFEIPDGYVMLCFGRSGLGVKHGISPTNCVGVIDSDYRGEVVCPLYNHFDTPYEVKVGDRIMQGVIVPYPKCIFVEKEVLSETSRGSGGLGSTGI